MNKKMEKLTGHGRPSNRFAGMVGQHYEDQGFYTFYNRVTFEIAR